MTKLPIKEPMLSGQGHHAYPLAIVSCQKRNLPWLYSHYINLCWGYEGIILDFCYTGKLLSDQPWSTYFGIPVLRTQKINLEILLDSKIDFIEFIRYNINNNNYIELPINEFFCNYSHAYKKYDFWHGVLIYGYENDYFNVLCYDKSGHFAQETININDFSDAIKREKSSINDLGRDIYIISQRENYSFPFNVDLVYSSICDYIGGNNSYNLYKIFDTPIKNLVFGINIYDELKKYILSCLDENGQIDLRILHLLYQHKIHMSQASEYMQDNGIIIGSCCCDLTFKKVAEKAKQLENMCLKYNITQNKILIEKIINKLDEVKKEDLNAFLALKQLYRK